VNYPFELKQCITASDFLTIFGPTLQAEAEKALTTYRTWIFSPCLHLNTTILRHVHVCLRFNFLLARQLDRYQLQRWYYEKYSEEGHGRDTRTSGIVSIA